MKRKSFLAVALIATILSSASQAQNVTVNRQDFGICAGSPWSTFGGWVAIAAGRVCSHGNASEGSGSGTVDWTFTDGPVEFNGLYFSGSGTFFLEILDGDNVIHTTQFSSSGTHTWVGVTHQGDASRIRIRRETGVGSFGIVDVPLDPVTNQSGDPDGPNGNGPNGNGPNGHGPNGNGPNGNGPNGNGPNGNGPDGNGPDGDGPPGNGPDGNGPPGPGDHETDNVNVDDALDDLVNQTNATPEPATLLLVASGLGGVGVLARRRSKRRSDEA